MDEGIELEPTERTWDNIGDAEKISGRSWRWGGRRRLQVRSTHFSATPSELKLWIVPRIDSRNLSSHRHAKETSFPSAPTKELPAFVGHAKSLWNKVFDNECMQQPTRPVSITGLGAVRFLSHSSIKSGWDHLKVAFYQMGKVGHSCFIAHSSSQ